LQSSLTQENIKLLLIIFICKAGYIKNVLRDTMKMHLASLGSIMGILDFKLAVNWEIHGAVSVNNRLLIDTLIVNR
jgi:hypothetical protein